LAFRDRIQHEVCLFIEGWTTLIAWLRNGKRYPRSLARLQALSGRMLGGYSLLIAAYDATQMKPSWSNHRTALGDDYLMGRVRRLKPALGRMSKKE